MNRAGRLAAGFFALALPGVAAQRASDIVYVPAAAHAQGVDFFQTDLVVTNAYPGTARVTLQFLPTGDGSQDNRGSRSLEVASALPVRGTLDLRDVLHETFGLDSAVGALIVFGCASGATCLEIGADGVPIGAAPLLVTSRTYSVRDGSTAGQAIPGIPFYDLSTSDGNWSPIPEDPAPRRWETRIPGLVDSGSGAAAPSYRTNVGFLNGSSDWTSELDLQFEDESGHDVALGSIRLGPLAHVQKNRLLRDFGLDDGRPYTLRITFGPSELASGVDGATAAAKGAVAYASIVDNASGDPTYLEAMFPASFETCEPAAAEARPIRSR